MPQTRSDTTRSVVPVENRGMAEVEATRTVLEMTLRLNALFEDEPGVTTRWALRLLRAATALSLRDMDSYYRDGEALQADVRMGE